MAQFSVDQALQSALRHQQEGRRAEAEHIYRQILAEQPNQVDALHNLGVLAGQDGRLEMAIKFLHRSIELDPNSASAFGNLGITLQRLGRYDEALEAHQQSVLLEPNDAAGQNNLAVTLIKLGQFDSAVDACLRAVASDPDFGAAFSTLGIAYKQVGEIELAIKSLRRAVELEPGRAAFHSNLLFAMSLQTGCDAAEISEACREWASRHERPFLANPRPHFNDRDPDRRLRVGYVSPDFRAHVVGRNVLPLLRERNRQSFEIFCYSNVSRADAVTQQFHSLSDHWRPIERLNDSKAAELVRLDRIDILVDLALHAADNRLLIFARKPAPVQMTFAGYPGTTGLQSIDYRLSDPYLDPPGATENQYSEQTIRLRDSFWCYDPTAMEVVADRHVSPLPAAVNGYITFGCLNNFAKTNIAVLALWAKVLCSVRGSRLLLLAPEGSIRPRITDRMALAGVESGRIEFVDRQTRAQYFQSYSRIDVALDTVPYNGHTTSLDAMWMGVPTVSLKGETMVGRAGFSQLSNVGLPELCANTSQEFIRISSALAADAPRLAELRRSLRARMLASPLTDAARFARSIEEAYRFAWQKWCQKK